jgi:hypothetical protein
MPGFFCHYKIYTNYYTVRLIALIVLNFTIVGVFKIYLYLECKYSYSYILYSPHAYLF